MTDREDIDGVPHTNPPPPAPWTAAPYAPEDAHANQGDYAVAPEAVARQEQSPPPKPPTRRRAGWNVTAALVAAAAVVTGVLLTRQGADPGGGQAGGTTPPAVEVSATGDAEVAATEAAPVPTVTETVTAEPAPTVTETVTPSPAAPSTASTAAAPRSFDDDFYCGSTGTLVALGYTARFEVVICDEGSLVYVGTNLESGNGITLDAQRAADGFSATNGATRYAVSSGGLYVTDPSGVLVDEAWEAWTLY